MVATVAEEESGSTFRETCLATELKPTMLHGATPAETCFAALLHISFRYRKVSTCNCGPRHSGYNVLMLIPSPCPKPQNAVFTEGEFSGITCQTI